MIITGKNLIKLGFEKQVQEPLIETKEGGFHYYTYEIKDKCLLISCSSDEKVNDGYIVEFYEMDIKFRDLKDLKALMKLINKVCNE